MKQLLQLLFLTLLFTTLTQAQISITADDFEEQLEIGYEFTTYNDRNTSSVDIGSTGETTWDFTGLTANDEFPTESKAVGSSPYASDFPGAQYAVNYEGTFEGTYSNVWAHNSIGAFLVSHGTGSFSNTQAGDVTTLITFENGWTQYKLPVQYQGTWDYSGTQTIETTFTIPGFGEQTNTIEQERTIEYLVDGYGTVTMPGGKTLNALRIREENQLTGEGVDQFRVIYHILTKTGESVSITLADGETANSGTVDIEAISWTSGEGDGVVVVDPVTAPGQLTAAAGESSITLNWVDLSDNETGFRVERAVSGSGSYSQVGETAADVTTYEDASAEAGVQYSYRVYAYNNDTESGFSNEATAMIEAAVTVNAPTALVATAGENSISLVWTDNSDNELGFTIERAEGGSAQFNTVGSVSANATTYEDATAQAGIQYTYRVYAFNDDTQSEFSNESIAMIEATVTINAPSDLFATEDGSVVMLEWTDNSDNESGFKIERSQPGTPEFIELGMVDANVTTYTDATAEKDITYTYRVYAYNNDARSGYSNDALTLIPIPPIFTPSPLTASAGESSITLEWTDNSNNESGFKIERKEGESSQFTEIGEVDADVTTYEDVSAEAGFEYTYRIYGYNDDTQSSYSNEVSAMILVTSISELNGLPTEFALNQNYPNPFNPSTTIQFSLPSAEYVSLKIYDVLGNEVADLVDQNLSPGNYSYTFDASNLSSGIYFYTIKASSFASTKKMMLIK